MSFLRRLFSSKPRRQPLNGQSTGAAGEQAAVQYLRGQGFRIVNRNWRCPLGEIDLVCEDGDVVVFVEVKSSRRLSCIPPEARVNPRKRRKLESLASYYQKHHHVQRSCRFDVVAVFWEDNVPRIHHYRNAFSSSPS